MKKLLVLVLLCISGVAVGQVVKQPWQKPSNPYGTVGNRYAAQLVSLLPTGCGDPAPLNSVDSSMKQAAVYFDSCAHRNWTWDPKLNAWDSTHLGVDGGSGIGNGIDDVIAVGQEISTDRTIAGYNGFELTHDVNSVFGKSFNLTGSAVAELTEDAAMFDMNELDSITTVNIYALDSTYNIFGIDPTNSLSGRILIFVNIGDKAITFRGATGLPPSGSIMLRVSVTLSDAYFRLNPGGSVIFKYDGAYWYVISSNTMIRAGIGIKLTNGSEAYGSTEISIADNYIPWTTTGNSGTTSGVNFIGTIDNENLRFRIFNGNSGRLTSDSSTYFGYAAGLNDNSSIYNSGFGRLALSQNTTGNFNSAFGYGALQRVTTGEQNSAFGTLALQFLTTGIKNNAMGVGALEQTTTGNFNSAVGQDAMLQNTTGSENVGIGWLGWSQNRTGHYNVGLGNSTGRSVFNGTKNVAVGFNSMYNVSQNDTVTNTIALGADTWTTKDNQMVLGNAALTETIIQGILRAADAPTQKMAVIDTISKVVTYRDIPAGSGSTGTVEEVATNDGTGIYGGPINVTGTLALDTANKVTTRLRAQHLIDSLAAAIGGGVPGIDDVLAEAQSTTTARTIDVVNNNLTVYSSTKGMGLHLDGSDGAEITAIGDYGSVNNSTVIIVDDAEEKIYFRENSLAGSAIGMSWQLVNTATGEGKWALDATSSGDPDILAKQALGSTVAAESVDLPITSAPTATALSDGQIRFMGVYLAASQTLTGVKVYMRTAGSYTGDNNSKVGLYTYSGGTLTLVASSTHSGTLWTAAANTYLTVPFSSTYAASPGMYFVAVLYNHSSQTTAPALSGVAFTNASIADVGFTNSAKMYGFMNAQADLPSSQAMSGITTLISPVWVAVY